MDPSPWPGVYRSGRTLYTRNLVPGPRVYGEEVRTESGVEYREWDPFRSKLAAYLLNASGAPGLDGVRSILYLGGAHGTTVSHLSDVCPTASIYAIEKSPTAFVHLLRLARQRTNVLPILADAQLPERYAADVGEVDFVYQDVAQRTQPAIFLENARATLRSSGQGLLMLKVRSVTQSRSPRAIRDDAVRELRSGGCRIVDVVDLAPFARDHAAIRVGSS